MSITVGTDTYITVAEATTYLGNHYLSSSAQLTAWNALSSADKEVLLRNATMSLERGQYRGFKKSITQTLAFPRCYHDKYYCETDVPDAVKYAQAEEALELASPSIGSQSYEMANTGVKSISIDDFIVSFKDIGKSGALKSVRAKELLSKYTNGSFPIR